MATARPTKIILVAFILTAVFFASKTASAESKLRGAAWWNDMYQYVYFDCADHIVGDKLDVPGNFNGDQIPPGFKFYSSPCANLPHHVTIDDNGNFTGSAWNSIKGFITFDSTSTPPDGYGFNSHCLNTCNASNNCTACYVEGSNGEQKVYGWAKIANDSTAASWIRLDSTLNPAVRLQSWDYINHNIYGGHNILPGDFIGYATSSVGNLSFNCESESGGNCLTKAYKVYVGNLQIHHTTAPNWTYTDACNTFGALNADLKWYLKSGTQSGFEVVVNTSSSFSTSSGNYVCWSGHKDGTSNHYAIPNQDMVGGTYTCQNLNYNTNYYWWVRLYDENGSSTPWYQYNSNSSSDTDGNPDGNAQTFTTYKHEFPTPYFDWSPFEIAVGTPVTFSSNGDPNNYGQSCYGGNCRYLWTTSDPNAYFDGTLATSSTKHPTTSISFAHPTSTLVYLRVTDSDNYVCSTSSPVIKINYDLPIWREVKAE